MLKTLFNFRKGRDWEECYMTGYINLYKKLVHVGYVPTMLEKVLYREALEALEKKSKNTLD